MKRVNSDRDRNPIRWLSYGPRGFTDYESLASKHLLIFYAIRITYYAAPVSLIMKRENLRKTND